ncbi:WD40 repeat domain-containing protein [Oleiagrimonas sp.]|jgi:DNA-binding beta-propeller fold protein YncE|uniref:YncE family protein n=1 Tax=Oleiagrimonas sp. TaxID=2010330 RepID=UPI00262C64D6|nr:WD40 repeat domain-containing protein [Oleiagrimonas sp.]MDA3914155.1 WD40 repeat domain-containing protein [Oleiagrimonas sp.]
MRRTCPLKTSAFAARLPGLLLVLVGMFGAGSLACQAATFYRLESAVVLPGTSPAWDYLTFDVARSYLFIGRRHAGVTVYDVRTRKVVASIADSKGANRAILVPEIGRGFTVNEDGSTTEFDLRSLKTLRRIRFGHDADSGSYDPATGQILFTMGGSRKIVFLDARSGHVTARLPLHSSKIEASAPDGHGNVFVAERDRNRVIRIDARAHKVTAAWSTAPCKQPTGLAYDAKDRRIFVGCRGDRPVLAVLNADSGKVVSIIEIGRGNDGVVYAPQTHRIYASNGVDANVVVIDQTGANTYRLDQAITTRPMARTMALDAKRDQIYLVTAQGAVDPARKVDRAVAPFYPNIYFDNTFVVLTYGKSPTVKPSVH